MRSVSLLVFSWLLITCSGKRNVDDLSAGIATLDLRRGEITLCGSGDQFGSVMFSAGCSDAVRGDFNVATALLHSFEYPEAEKVFARVIDADPSCIMAYWGAAMSLFHPLWEPPSRDDLEKGARVVAMARSIIDEQGSGKEADYLEAIATIYDDYTRLEHGTRLAKFEEATRSVHEKYPDDREASVFYALALRAAADPADKSYAKQRQAGKILEDLEKATPNHPGIVHYLIHVYDYPELAGMGLSAARSYASVAAASAHAQHMPSHIFTRLGLWDDAIQSNLNSISSAQCYAQNAGIKGHWDEELHGMDYAVYAYLQKGDLDGARRQLDSLTNLGEVHPANFKVAYSVAAMPARYALECRDWDAASKLKLSSLEIPWETCQWEKANHTFARALGFAHKKELDQARAELKTLTDTYQQLKDVGDAYKSNLVLVQVRAVEAWIKLAGGSADEAIRLMTQSADLEDATEKHSVTPGELIPARELLADLYVELHDYDRALEAYKLDLQRHPNRFNGLYGAGYSAERAGKEDEAKRYFETLLEVADPSSARTELKYAKTFVGMH
jgi:tetratricopeptide (TPR) repeat protein